MRSLINNSTFEVKLVTLDEPLGNVGHVLLKCPRCQRGIGITIGMFRGVESIICKGRLGETGSTCNGHYYFERITCTLSFVGTVN